MRLFKPTWNPATQSCSNGSQAMTTPSTPTLRVMCRLCGRGTHVVSTSADEPLSGDCSFHSGAEAQSTAAFNGTTPVWVQKIVVREISMDIQTIQTVWSKQSGPSNLRETIFNQMLFPLQYNITVKGYYIQPNAYSDWGGNNPLSQGMYPMWHSGSHLPTSQKVRLKS